MASLHPLYKVCSSRVCAPRAGVPAAGVEEAAHRQTGCGDCPGTRGGHTGSPEAPGTGDTQEAPLPALARRPAWGNRGRNQTVFLREAGEVLPPPVGMAGSHQWVWHFQSKIWLINKIWFWFSF